MFPNLNAYTSHTLKRLCTVMCAATFAVGCSPADPISVEDPRIRELIPGRTTTAAYFSIRNQSDTALTLTGAESSRTSSIEMHTMVTNGDRVGMRRVPEVVVEAGSSVDFAPGGLHLMVFGVEDETAPFPITLTFADGTRLPLNFRTLSLTPES